MYTLSHLFNNEQVNLPLLEMICKSIYYSTGLPAGILDSDGRGIYLTGQDNHYEQFFPNIASELLPFVKNQHTSNGNGLYIYDTPYEFSFLVMPLYEYHHFKGVLIFGPYTVRGVDEHMINEILNTHQFPISQRESIKNFYATTTIISASRSYFIQQLILSSITNSKITTMMSNHDQTLLDTEPLSIRTATSDAKKPDYNYALEILFLTKVKNGDIEKVLDLFNEHIKTDYLNSHTNEPLRVAKNRSFSLSTLMARAVIDGGVEADQALSLEAHYREHIESSRNLKDLVALIEQMVAKYTNTILQLSNVNHVSVIKNASKYVHMHLSEPIRLNDVADYVSLSPNYFSSLFKREMNISFADYVNQTRIKESQYLLETTNHSILDIALSVGYNNQNYFTTIFRKFTGITPKQYRMRSAK